MSRFIDGAVDILDTYTETLGDGTTVTYDRMETDAIRFRIGSKQYFVHGATAYYLGDAVQHRVMPTTGTILNAMWSKAFNSIGGEALCHVG